MGFDPQRIQALVGKAPKQRPALGLSIADASRMAVKAGAIPVFGAFVGKVAPGSPAEKAGIRPGDIITEANFRPISNAADLESALKSTTAGSRLALVAMRGDRSLRFQITL
ncbi:MAG: PDZ domain-containing protein [Chloroflexota bacterium]